MKGHRNVNCFLRQRKKLIFPGGVYHITQRATGSEPLFLEEADYLYALHLIKKASQKFNFNMFCFTLMPNHIHLLLKIIEKNLSEGMKSIFEAYAKFFNHKYARKGHAFCGRYRGAICLDDRHLLAASLYIHLNPVKAGLVTNPIDYRWSSCAAFINPGMEKTFLRPDFILRLLSESIPDACEIYKDLLTKSNNLLCDNILEKRSALADFSLKLDTAFKGIIKGTAGSGLNEILMGKDLAKKLQEIKNLGRLRLPESLKARKFLIEQLKSRGFSISEAAKIMCISRQAIYNSLT